MARHRTVINGIVWKLTTGVPWRDLPGRYGPWQTGHSRLLRWKRDGTCAKLLRHVQQHSDAVGDVVWEVSAPGRRWPGAAPGAAPERRPGRGRRPSVPLLETIRVTRPCLERLRGRPDWVLSLTGTTAPPPTAAPYADAGSRTPCSSAPTTAATPCTSWGPPPAFDAPAYRRRNVVEIQ